MRLFLKVFFIVAVFFLLFKFVFLKKTNTLLNTEIKNKQEAEKIYINNNIKSEKKDKSLFKEAKNDSNDAVTEETNEIKKSVEYIINNYIFLDSPDTTEGIELLNKIQKLKLNPQASYKEINKLLTTLNYDDENIKQFLIQFTTQLAIDKKQKLDFLHKQLIDSVKNVNVNNEQTLFTPSIIFETFINISQDALEIEKVLSEAVLYPPSVVIKRLNNLFFKFKKRIGD